ncbi:hypothetical protein OG233_10870 [Streptomyces sp. NBC_01218]|uniref:hypothetical protein n=1 Tax=unclassified Streptomyces TaxID=2593676 RepID=UPI0023B929F5|nr:MULTISPECIES: hypothetical protein [unclassified Streptomyces]WEH39948.1 hypothetical protein PZB77_10715 [Streptomyces sp. AM 2-1-1]WSQ51639.1 hypothetical protein OG233_10870 [Streptomyces sp. NBC_01218]
MSLFSEKHLAVLVLRDAPAIGDALRAELAAAPAADRPGLERALALVGRYADRPEHELRARWVRERLTAVGYEGAADSTEAIGVLRRAEPALSLLQAVTYAREAAAAEA